MQSSWQFVFWGILALTLAGCGGSSNLTSPPPTNSSPQTITMTFTESAPTAAAVQMGTGAFTPVAVQNKQISFTLPGGISKYALAFVCPTLSFGSPQFNTTSEVVLEATAQDGTSISTPNCSSGVATGNLSGTADASLIAGTSQIRVVGSLGAATTAVSGTPFNVNLPTGINDVAVVALDVSGNVLAVRIIHSQAVPGTLNGGSPVILNSNDATTLQTVTENNAPAGLTPFSFVEYFTANGTLIVLQSSTNLQYPAIPAASVQAGDFYLFNPEASNAPANSSVVSVFQSSTTAGPLTVTMPQPWSSTPPLPGAFPTFGFNYSGFSGQPTIVDEIELDWLANSTNGTDLSVKATASFQNGANTITVPDLTALPGFLPSATSGTTVQWLAAISGGSELPLSILIGGFSPNTSYSQVESKGAYTAP